jgi:hypothetical protein
VPLDPATLPAFGDLTPDRLWPLLDTETRRLAARAVYVHAWSSPGPKREADTAVAAALRFRDTTIRKLPVEKRADALARVVRPDASLASSLLLALHLEHRRPMLKAFMDALEIPNEEGVIADGHELKPPGHTALAAAVERLRGAFPPDEVQVYLASLLALDPDTWGPLAPLL